MMDSKSDLDEVKTNTNTDAIPKNLPSVSVCIPCVPVHVHYLSDCLSSILQQTVLPEEVILIVSESTPEIEDEVKNLIKKFPAFEQAVSIKCQFFSETQHPGVNRNAAVNLATQTLILFIDADDLMCPVRVATAKNIFFDHPHIVGFMHFFKKTIKDAQEADEDFMHRTFKTCEALFQESLLWETPYDNHLVKAYQFTFDITFGQPTLKRSLFSEESYAYNAKRIVEDVDFIASLLPKHIDHLLTYERQLTFYMQCRSSKDHEPADNKKPLMYPLPPDIPLIDVSFIDSSLTLNSPKESLIFNAFAQDPKPDIEAFSQQTNDASTIENEDKNKTLIKSHLNC